MAERFALEARELGLDPTDATLLRLFSRCAGLVPHSAFDPVGRFDHGYAILTGSLEEGEGSEDDSIAEQAIRMLWEHHYGLDASRPITLVISSPGGSTYLGLAVISAINDIRREGRVVNAHVAGWAWSAAADIVQFCDHRTIEPTGSLMLHEEQAEFEGSSSSRLRDAEAAKKAERLVFEQIAARTGRPVKYYVDKTDGKDWYLTAPEALAEGLVDEILGVPSLPKSPAVGVRSGNGRPRTRAARTPDVVT
jgi:ATP-dependent protease ClpP protease subunit